MSDDPIINRATSDAREVTVAIAEGRPEVEQMLVRLAGADPGTDDGDFLLEPEELARLPAEDQARYRRVLRTLVGGESYEAFVLRLTPEEPVPRHGRLLAETLERCRLRPRRVGWSWPPGHGKTTLLVRGIAHGLSVAPSDTSGFVTYDGIKANRHSREVRDLVRKSGIALNPEAQAVSDWRTVYGGGLWAGGIRGKGTGYRNSGMIVLDDPYRRIEDALSAAYRSMISGYVRAVASTRSFGGSLFASHTRWHDQDLLGELASIPGWRLVNLPAIAEAGDPLGRAVGEALWPEMFPAVSCRGPCGHADHLDAIRESSGEWTWAALYQGRPVPLSGGVFRPAWWEFADFCEPGESVRAWDVAATDAPRGPATVGAKITRTMIGEYFIENVFRARLSPAGVDQAILAMALHDGPSVRVSLPQDPGQAGKAQAAHWSKMLDGFTFEITPEGSGTSDGSRSKLGRALPYASQVEQGNFFLVRGAGWTGRMQGRTFELVAVPNWQTEWIAEHAMCPAGELWDQIDAGSRGYHALHRSHGIVVGAAPKIFTYSSDDDSNEDDDR